MRINYNHCARAMEGVNELCWPVKRIPIRIGRVEYGLLKNQTGF